MKTARWAVAGLCAALLLAACGGEPSAAPGGEVAQKAAAYPREARPVDKPKAKKERKRKEGCTRYLMLDDVGDAKVEATLSIDGEDVPLRHDPEAIYNAAMPPLPLELAGVCGSVGVTEGSGMTVVFTLGLTREAGDPVSVFGVFGGGDANGHDDMRLQIPDGKEEGVVMLKSGKASVSPQQLAPGKVSMDLSMAGELITMNTNPKVVDGKLPSMFNPPKAVKLQLKLSGTFAKRREK